MNTKQQEFIELACKYYEQELIQFVAIANKLKRGGGDIINVAKSVDEFKKYLTNKIK